VCVYFVCVCVCVCVCMCCVCIFCVLDGLLLTISHSSTWLLRKTMPQLVKMQNVVSYYSVIHFIHQTRDVRIVLWWCRVDVGVGACESVRGSVWVHVRV